MRDDEANFKKLFSQYCDLFGYNRNDYQAFYTMQQLRRCVVVEKEKISFKALFGRFMDFIYDGKVSKSDFARVFKQENFNEGYRNTRVQLLIYATRTLTIELSPARRSQANMVSIPYDVIVFMNIIGKMSHVSLYKSLDAWLNERSEMEQYQEHEEFKEEEKEEKPKRRKSRKLLRSSSIYEGETSEASEVSEVNETIKVNEKNEKSRIEKLERRIQEQDSKLEDCYQMIKQLLSAKKSERTISF